MSISTIGQAMALYAQPSEFDQDAWKQAFDIANGFAESSEAQRRNRENLATSEWRVGALNAANQDKINQANWDIKNRDMLGTQKTGFDLWDYGRRQQNGDFEDTVKREEYERGKKLSDFILHNAFNEDGTPKTDQEKVIAAQKAFGDDSRAYVASLGYIFPQTKFNDWQAREDYQFNQKRILSYEKERADILNSGEEPGVLREKLIELNSRYPDQLAWIARMYGPQNQGGTQETTQTGTPEIRYDGQQPAPAQTATPTQTTAPVQTTPAETAPAQTSVRPLTQEEQHQKTIDNLRAWGNGGADKFWADLWASMAAKNERTKKENEMKSQILAEAAKNYVIPNPYYLTPNGY